MRTLIITLILASCSGAPTVPLDPTTGAGDVAPTSSLALTTTVAVSTSAANSVPDPEPDVFEENSAVFIAALEQVVADTAFSGAALDSPQVFLAAAEIMCERLDNEDSVDDVLADYLNGLTKEGGEIPQQDRIVLAGGVLGVGVELFCPRHSELIEETP